PAAMLREWVGKRLLESRWDGLRLAIDAGRSLLNVRIGIVPLNSTIEGAISMSDHVEESEKKSKREGEAGKKSATEPEAHEHQSVLDTSELEGDLKKLNRAESPEAFADLAGALRQKIKQALVTGRARLEKAALEEKTKKATHPHLRAILEEKTRDARSVVERLEKKKKQAAQDYDIDFTDDEP
ncbi:MAG TPA: hypothetical protein VFZ53_32940, partial [Polyangiaceae bacterium]